MIELLELEKSLVYFTTSLRSNETVLEKLLRTEKIKKYPEDEDLLEDVIVENKQAIEMAKIYSDILSGTMDAFASVISNNLNVIMKFLSTRDDRTFPPYDDRQLLRNELSAYSIGGQPLWILYCDCDYVDRNRSFSILL